MATPRHNPEDLLANETELVSPCCAPGPERISNKTKTTGDQQMIRCYGYKDGKYQIFETERGIKLDFQGADADKFEQVNPPERPTDVVVFSLTLNRKAPKKSWKSQHIDPKST